MGDGNNDEDKREDDHRPPPDDNSDNGKDRLEDDHQPRPDNNNDDGNLTIPHKASSNTSTTPGRTRQKGKKNDEALPEIHITTTDVEIQDKGNASREATSSKQKTLDQRFTEINPINPILAATFTPAHLTASMLLNKTYCVCCGFHGRVTPTDEKHWATCVWRMYCKCSRCSRHNASLEKRRRDRQERRAIKQATRIKNRRVPVTTNLLTPPTPQGRPDKKFHRPWEDTKR